MCSQFTGKCVLFTVLDSKSRQNILVNNFSVTGIKMCLLILITVIINLKARKILWSRKLVNLSVYDNFISPSYQFKDKLGLLQAKLSTLNFYENVNFKGAPGSASRAHYMKTLTDVQIPKQKQIISTFTRLCKERARETGWTREGSCGGGGERD